jgi:hypothetical protein
MITGIIVCIPIATVTGIMSAQAGLPWWVPAAASFFLGFTACLVCQLARLP